MIDKTVQKGFTLIEITIVLLILGLLIAGILGPLSIRVEQKQRQETQDQLDDIKNTLIGFAITEGRLPCPDCRIATAGSCNDPSVTLNDGREDRIGAAGSQTCAADVGSNNYYSIGNLPWVDLGVSEFDAWREHFTYAVTSDFADESYGASNEDVNNRPNPCGTATVGVSFELCSGGNLDIQTVDENDPSRPIVPIPLVDNVPALVFSGAKNDFTAQATPSPLEQENTNNDNVFFYDDYRLETNNEFDDLMIWISPNILKYRMVQAGRLP